MSAYMPEVSLPISESPPQEDPVVIMPQSEQQYPSNDGGGNVYYDALGAGYQNLLNFQANAFNYDVEGDHSWHDHSSATSYPLTAPVFQDPGYNPPSTTAAGQQQQWKPDPVSRVQERKSFQMCIHKLERQIKDLREALEEQKTRMARADRFWDVSYETIMQVSLTLRKVERRQRQARLKLSTGGMRRPPVKPESSG